MQQQESPEKGRRDDNQSESESQCALRNVANQRARVLAHVFDGRGAGTRKQRELTRQSEPRMTVSRCVRNTDGRSSSVWPPEFPSESEVSLPATQGLIGHFQNVPVRCGRRIKDVPLETQEPASALQCGRRALKSQVLGKSTVGPCSEMGKKQ